MSATAVNEPLAPGVVIPPGQDELPYDDGVPMETARHRLQMELLIASLQPWLDQREDGFIGGNMFVYFSELQIRNQDFKGPDFFAVLNVPKGERKSWVVWGEDGRTPDVVIELLSESTAEADKTSKKQIYQNNLKVENYYWFDPFKPDDWAGFKRENNKYKTIPLTPENQLPCPALGLALTRWNGSFQGIETTWLRWITVDGELLLTYEETERQRANAERQRADAEQQRADQAEQELARLKALLKEKGIEGN